MCIWKLCLRGTKDQEDPDVATSTDVTFDQRSLPKSNPHMDILPPLPSLQNLQPTTAHSLTHRSQTGLGYPHPDLFVFKAHRPARGAVSTALRAVSYQLDLVGITLKLHVSRCRQQGHRHGKKYACRTSPAHARPAIPGTRTRSPPVASTAPPKPGSIWNRQKHHRAS